MGEVGDQLLRMAAGVGLRGRFKEPSERWLAHCLAVADLHLTLVGAARRGELEVLEVQTEPASWRPYLGLSGSPLVLKPDLYAVTATSEFEDHWYIELDRATESLPTLLGKCAQYEAYRRTGQDQEQRGVSPIVAWVVPSVARAIKLRAAIRRSRRLNPDVFQVTTNEGFLDLMRGGAG